MKYLPKYFAYLIESSVFLLQSCKSTSYVFEVSPLSDICPAVVFPAYDYLFP